MIAPLFGTKSALDHPADRPAILRIFLSDRYPLFPQHHRVFDSFSHFAGPKPGLLVASPPGLRREIPPTASDIRPRHACTAPANAAGFPSETYSDYPKRHKRPVVPPEIPPPPLSILQRDGRFRTTLRSIAPSPFLRLPAAGRKLRVRTPVPNGLRRTFFPRREREI